MAWDVSPAYLATLVRSHEIVSRVDVWRGGVLLMANLPVVDGTVSVTEESGIRRAVSLTIPRTFTTGGADANPVDANSLLSPYGTELAVYSGLRTTSGYDELVPVGVFGIRSAATSSAYGVVTVTGKDRSQRVDDARFTSVRQLDSAVTVVSAIRSLLLEVDSSWEVYDETGSTARAAAAVYERDRRKAIEALADSIGAEVYPDPAGRWIIRPTVVVPTAAQLAAAVASGYPRVWQFAGGDGGALVDVGTSISSDGIFNAVVAVAEPEQGAPPITATARISVGPLRWSGPFGQRPRFYSSPVLRTVQQCKSAAASLLVRSHSFSRVVSPETLPNPAVDAGDWCSVRELSGLTTPAVVRAFDVPLAPGSMSVAVRVAGESETVEGVT